MPGRSDGASVIRVSLNVLDDDPLAEAQRPAAGRVVLSRHLAEEVEKVLCKPALRRDLQDVALAIQQLHIALVGAEQLYRSGKDLFEPVAQVPKVPKPRRRPVQPRQRGSFSCRFGDGCPTQAI